MTDPTGPTSAAPQLRSGLLIIATADVLDFVTIVLLGGLVVAWLTGNLTGHGWVLYRWAGWLHTAVIVLYFCSRRLAPTLWQRILRIR